MNYSTSDRFQGVWLGSIIGAALSNNVDRPSCDKIRQFQSPCWIQTRDRIAQVIVKSPPIESVFKQSTQIVAKYSLDNFKINIQDETKNCNGNSDQKIILKNRLSNYYCNLISILLSLIVIQEDNKNFQKLCKTIISQSNIPSSLTPEIEEEIATWNYLLTLALNNKFKLEEPNISMMVKQVLGGVKVKASSLVAKLEIVSQAWERGLSLQQLAEKLYQQENKLKLTASLVQPEVSFVLAMSFYCFISTPKNFMLSVKRATKISSNLSVPITVFTASLSGAYNGISGIPRNWKMAASHHQLYQQAQTTSQRLFKTWLGVHNPDNLELLYDLELHAVANPKIFQHRPNLKIISQKSSLS